MASAVSDQEMNPLLLVSSIFHPWSARLLWVRPSKLVCEMRRSNILIDEI